MSSLRRRIFGGGDSPEPSRDPSPAPIRTDPQTPDVASVPIEKLLELNQASERAKRSKKGTKRRNAWIFGLGGLFGVILAVFFAGPADLRDLAYLKDLNLDSLFDVLPAGLIRDAQELQRHERDAVAYDSFSVGLHARSQGVEAHHPVIMVPGVISTGLESWSTEDEDARSYFRKRLWGSWSMMRALVMDKAAWKKHVMLDMRTGLDPPGIKLRAAQGFDATDFFITGYWIWNKILENLATIGYDPTNAFTAAYDWRLSYANLEVRDQYFSRLKNHIEQAHALGGRKVVLLSHSMGSQVLFYFLHWVEAHGPGYGNGGDAWVEEHIDSWINISGSMLGAVKDVPALLSGEMKDTAQLNSFAVYGLEKFLSRHERAEVLRAMPGISSMLPIGGDAVWGDAASSPDDLAERNSTFGTFITFRNPASPHARNMTVGESVPYLFRMTEDWYSRAVQLNYSLGIAHTAAEVEANQRDPRKWMNPLETRLPKAPSLKIYCFYGYGKETERAYYYHEDKDPATKNKVTIDTAYSDAATHTDHGVIMGEGDGTVNLLSTGYMCARGWKYRRYNPANVSIVVNEMLHEPEGFNPRGGPNTGDHVDILGRSSLNDLILRVAGGKGDLVEQAITSNIERYAARVRVYEEGDS